MKKDIKYQLVLILFFTFLCALVIFPFLMLVSISFSKESDIVTYGYSIFPKNFDLSAYKYVFNNPKSILNAYSVTVLYSVIATVLGTLVMAMCAYPISRKNLRGKSGISFYLYFTMLFSGGLVPLYILNTQYLHLNDKIWIYIIPTLVNPWYVFMMRTFFRDLPEEIFESLHVDGADEYRIFFGTVLALSKPVLATVALLTFLTKWNDWMTSMLYINNQNLISLQYLLQRTLNNLKLIQEMSTTGVGVGMSDDVPGETARMAMAIIVAGPALFVFPFFQKYFVKGLTVGAVKG